MRLFAIWVQAGLKTLVRTPRSAFFTLVFPLILLLLIDSANSGGTVTAAGGKVDFAQYFTPSLAIFGLSFACYTSLVFSIPRAREQGILKRIRGTPLPTSAYLAGIFGSAVTNTASQIVIISVAGRPVDYVAQLDEVPSETKAEPFLAGPEATPLREDVVNSAPLARPPAAMAPEFADGFFLVPRHGAMEDL